ncbi:MAG: hypothetical protein JNK32_04245 [Anaerolineales bacterium]|nr:hypothetical protein [Anaerolineales bacterium]
MNIPSILGFVGTIIGLVRAVPQLVRLLRARGAFGVSVDTAATSSIVSLGWAVYGLLTGQTYVVLATGSSGLIFAIITGMALRYGRSVREFKVAPIWLVVLLITGFAFGTDVLGIVLALSALVSNMPQIWVAYREDNLKGLSLGTWLLSLSDGLVWGTYALLQHDISIIASGAFQSATSALIVARILYQQSNKKALESEMISN